MINALKLSIFAHSQDNWLRAHYFLEKARAQIKSKKVNFFVVQNEHKETRAISFSRKTSYPSRSE